MKSFERRLVPGTGDQQRDPTPKGRLVPGTRDQQRDPNPEPLVPGTSAQRGDPELVPGTTSSTDRILATQRLFSTSADVTNAIRTSKLSALSIRVDHWQTHTPGLYPIDVQTIYSPTADAHRKTQLIIPHGSMHNASLMQPLGELFSSLNYVVHLISYRGHGESAPQGWMRRVTRRFYSLGDYAEDFGGALEAIRARHRPSAVVAIPWSLSGAVVPKWLQADSAHLNGMVLLAPVPVNGVLESTINLVRDAPTFRLKASIAWGIAKTTFTLNLRKAFGSPQLTHYMLYSDSMPAEQAAKNHELLEPVESGWQYAESLTKTSLKIFTDKILAKGINVGLIAGADDRIMREKQMRETAAAYRIEPIFVPGLAHGIPQEARCPEVVRHAARLLESWGLAEYGSRFEAKK